jgi:hypothetical protein
MKKNKVAAIFKKGKQSIRNARGKNRVWYKDKR